MGRRKQKHLIPPQALLTAGAALGVLWLIVNALDIAGGGIGVAILMVVGAVLAFAIFRGVRRANERKLILEKVASVTSAQLESLLRRRAQLVRLDPYGKPVHDKWSKEIGYFITEHVRPTLDASEQDTLTRHLSEVSTLIRNRVEAAQQVRPAFGDFSDDMTPAEFETFCAEQLRQAGWNARVTLQSRDQGVDVVAEKSGRRVVLQCKLYARPVGNKAVQEATAAKMYERADFGIVVSNNRYTDDAERLAQATGIMLLHHRDLQNLDNLLGRAPTSPI